MPRRREAPSPAYPLEKVQALVGEGRFIMTQSAERGMQGIGATLDDVVDYVCDLRTGDLDKSDPSRKQPGQFLDIYMGEFEEPDGTDIDLYIKVQVFSAGDGGEKVRIVSFKRWGAP